MNTSVGIGIGISYGVRVTGGPGFSLTAPVLTLLSSASDNTPLWGFDLVDPQAGDIIRIEWDDAIPFVTAVNHADYEIQSGDLSGDFEFDFGLSAFADGPWSWRAYHIRGATSSAVSNEVSETIATVAAPVNTVAPAVTGGAWLHGLLTTTDGTWNNSPTSYTYQWTRGGVNIGGATSATYTLVAADRGQNIVCVVTATNAGGSTPQASNTTACAAAGTNLFTKTEILSNAYWTSSHVTVGDNDTTAPDGTSTADDVREDNALSAHEHYNASPITITSGVDYTLSAFVKPNERTIVQLNLAINANTRTWFNLSGAGSVLTNNNTSAGIQAIGNGWYRVWVRRASTSTSAFGGMALASADNTPSYTGVTGNGIWIWGEQLEQASSPSSYSAVA